MTIGAKTFISFDEPDGLGVRAQVIVTVGSLPVKRVDPSNGIARVEFDHKAAENLKFGISANVLESSPFYDALVEAAGTGQPVSFRLETQRKGDIDRRAAFPPASEDDRVEGVKYLTTQGTGKDNDVVKKLVRVNGVNNEEIRTNPDEDQKWSNVPRAQIPAFIDVADAPTGSAGGASVNMDHVLGSLKAMAGDGGYSPVLVGPLAAMAISGGAAPAEVSAMVDKATRPAAPKSGVTRGGIKESSPWYADNFDGARNLGSYEVGAALSVTGWAEKYLTGALKAYVEAHPDKSMDLSPTAEGRLQQVKALAAAVLEVADAVQVNAYGRDVAADRSVASHGKARGVVFHVVESVVPMSFPDAVFSGQRQQWFDQVLALSIERFTAAIEVLDNADALVGDLGVTIGSAAAPAREERPAASAKPTVAAVPDEPAEEIVVETVPEAVVETVDAVEMAQEALNAVEVPQVAEPRFAFLSSDLGPNDKDEMGGEAPNPDDVAAFNKLLTIAKVADDSAVVSDWLNACFAVTSVEELHGPRLRALLDYYRSFGKGAVDEFRHDLHSRVAA